MSKKSDLVKNTLIIAIGKLSSQLITFALVPAYTIFLNPSEYGLVDLAITYVALAVSVITLQIDRAAFRYLIDARDNDGQKKIIISITAKIVLFTLLASFLLLIIFSFFVAIPYIVVILTIVVSTSLSGLTMQLARGLGHNKKFSIASIVTGLSMLTSVIVLVIIMRLGAVGALLSVAISNAVCVIYLFFAIKLYKYIDLSIKDRILKTNLLKYSMPLIPSRISWWAISVSDRTLIAIFIGIAANGIYAVSNKLAALFMAAYAIFDMSWTESASVHIDSKDRDKFFSEVHNSSLKLFGSLGLVLIAFLPIFFNILIDKQFNEAYLYIPILVIAAFFNSIVAMYSVIYIAKKLTNKVLRTSLFAALINISINLLFIKFIGIYAAALSTLIAYLVMGISRHYDVKKYVKITYEKKLFFIFIFMYAVSCVLYYMNNLIGNIVNIILVIFVAIYINRLILCKTIRKIKSNLLKRKLF